MIELAFNQHFQSEFMESKTIVAAKLINLDPDLIKKLEIDGKRSKIF